MLDMGFIVPIRQIVPSCRSAGRTCSSRRPCRARSASSPPSCCAIRSRVSVTPVATTVERVNQSVIFVEPQKKRALLTELFADPAMQRVLVFTRTKRGADKVARHLEAAASSSPPSTATRARASARRRSPLQRGRMRGLVATDIAARGIDIDEVTHVVNFELPDVPESYVHRIGRTARAGAEGIAISFCADEERALLRDIERADAADDPGDDRSGDASLVSTAGMGSSGERGHRHQQWRSTPRRPEQRRPQGRRRSSSRRPPTAAATARAVIVPSAAPKPAAARAAAAGKRHRGNASVAR